MRLSLSTNWCNRRLETGEEIADAALALGFEELELGYHTTQLQVKGFKARLDQIPVGSVHAFCPVPISAPEGYPELYMLTSPDEEERKMARLQISRNIAFAADMGADTVVLHAGRVPCGGLFRSREMRRRVRRGRKVLEPFRRELGKLLPVLESHRVTLALENLPYIEGFPSEDELTALLSGEFRGARVKGWFDTGHARVRQMNGWGAFEWPDQAKAAADSFAGMHLNDVVDVTDDHLPPGEANVDFAALKTFAENVRHVVFEPHSGVTAEALRKSVGHIRTIWNL